MRKVWVKVIPYNKRLITTALESGAHAIWVEPSEVKKVKELARIDVISEEGDLKPQVDFNEIIIRKKEDEEKALSLSKTAPVVVEGEDWTIIPLENLVAQSENIFTVVKDEDQMEIALGVLEKGVAGVVIDVKDPELLRKLILKALAKQERIPLLAARILRITPLSLGERVCVDTCTLMGKGEGMLVGNSSSFLFLVHAESIENPYVAPRPFRVNAGAVHSYILLPEGRTKYLSEITAGDEVMIVNYKGESSKAIVGRAKTEKRPLMLIEAEAQGKKGSCILQNAETIRLVAKNGDPISIVKLKEKDEVMVYLEEGGRHFGIKIKETISEK